MTLLSAVDIGNVALPAAQALGRILVVVIASVAAMRIARVLIGRVDDNRFREQLMFFVPKIVAVVVGVVGLSAIGIDVSGMAAIMATVGVTGAVVFTPVGQNFVAGAMIRIDDIYQDGEAVTVGELHGKVVYRSLLRTELELPDGSKAWVPNSVFQENQVLNHSRMGGWRVSVQVPLDRASDRATAQTVMDDVVASLDWNSPGKHAFVAFDYVGSEAMFFTAYAWIDDRTQEPWYRGLLLSALVDALEDAGVSVGQTTNLSLASSRRDADLPVVREQV
ncbi:MAG: mechanosensitive ion channel domain-containing protein [Ilumatobacteraceae bacterium]|jgi:small-conductance mechanosensitive channel